MIRTVIKESLLYLTILILLAFLMHPDLLSAPAERFTHMLERQNYLHPLFYAFLLYLLLMLFRLIFRGIKKVLRR